MPCALARWSCIALATVGAACDGPAPARVQLELASPLLGSEPTPATLRLWDDDGVSRTSRDSHDYSSSSPDVASVTKHGVVTCQKSGDATISVTVRGKSAEAKVACRPVASVEVSLPDRLVIQDGPRKLAVRVLSKDGAELSDVPVTARSSSSKAVRIKGLEVEPAEVGDTTITVQAGAARAETKTRVVRRVDVAPVPIGKGERVSYSLEAGTYEVTVRMKAPRKVKTEWLAARGCDKTTEEAEHRSQCSLQGKSQLIVDNPAYLDGGGGSEIRGVDVFQIP